MAYTLPTFNLACDIYTMVTASPSSRVLRVPGQVCQLRAPTRGATGQTAHSPNTTANLRWSIIFPALTDVRELGQLNTTTLQNYADLINCPSGSNRWYLVALVDDAAKGFANEYRVAVVYKARFVGEPTWWEAPYE